MKKICTLSDNFSFINISNIFSKNIYWFYSKRFNNLIYCDINNKRKYFEEIIPLVKIFIVNDNYLIVISFISPEINFLFYLYKEIDSFNIQSSKNIYILNYIVNDGCLKL